MEKIDHLPTSCQIVQKSLIWKFPKELGGFTLYGNSWACDHTAFQIPELNWGLDIGYIPHPARRSHLFVTHAHGDHSTSMPFVVNRRCPPEIFLPEDTVDSCKTYLESFLGFRLHGQDVGVLLPSYALRGVKPKQKIKLSGKLHADKVVEIFEMHHSVVCVGYGFLQEKKKLKPEFIGKTGKELGELRKQGVALDAFYESPMFAFLGDTTTQFFDEQAVLERNGEESIFRFPLIIVECTFLGTDEADEERAANKKHVYWPLLKPFVVSHPKILFVLIHFSHRYNSQEIREFFEKEDLANVVPFVASKQFAIVEMNEQDEGEDDH